MDAGPLKKVGILESLGRGRFAWVWWIFSGLVVVVGLGWLSMFLYGAYLHGEKYATEDAVAFIESQKLTLADVQGDNLPPPPDSANTTLEGVDANLNGIRDDVELAIFEMYPTAPDIRAAELQYAKALQLELSKWVFNEETLAAVIRAGGRASFCLTETGPEIDLSMTQEEVEKRFAVTDQRKEEVENLVFNTDIRKARQEEVYRKYMTSYGSWSDPACDLDPETLE